MEKDNRENINQYSSADFMVKRKRGRPRKQLGIDSGEQGLGSSSGHERRSRNHPRQRDDVMVGQPVSGVIEAGFEAGYLLSVKVGNSSNVLRGVVFKPGRCVPLSEENDVAPNVPMIPRNSIPHSRKSRFREEPDLFGVKSRALVPILSQSTQPAHLQNGGLVPDPSRAPPQAAVPINQAPPADVNIGSELIMQSGAGHGKPFETLLTEVMMNRVQVQGKMASVEADSDEQALSIEPLQAIHPVHPVHIPKPVPGYRRGKMTELLQENVRDSHVSGGQ
ncbi:PREDICTED: uncharacterized protein LOC104813422 isoform X2 [Tarenaya hassleriana]|uniref:uncharacterized protein LOC104813422 isoform X2 n=1 Tax=Tarenaya hassleriana TaxID=28532 RepID=UPI00053CA106|nr:PREDICTED: uncharacterized protein LOC104813422 isoform X2 [Tarenaya hassleriana]